LGLNLSLDIEITGFIRLLLKVIHDAFEANQIRWSFSPSTICKNGYLVSTISGSLEEGKVLNDSARVLSSYHPGLASVASDAAIDGGRACKRASLPFKLGIKTGIRSFFAYELSIEVVVLLDSVAHDFLVPVGDGLLGCPSNSVVMLHNTKSIKHGMLVVTDLLDSLIRDLLLKKFFRIYLAGGVEVGLGLPVHLLGVGARGEVTSPIIIGLVSVGEHVVVADGPLNLLLFERVHIVRWG